VDQQATVAERQRELLDKKTKTTVRTMEWTREIAAERKKEMGREKLGNSKSKGGEVR